MRSRRPWPPAKSSEINPFPPANPSGKLSTNLPTPLTTYVMRIDTAWLLGNCVGSAVWGIYCTLFFLTMWASHRRGPDNLRSPVICGVICLFVLNLGLTGFHAAISYEAFITTNRSTTAFLESTRGYLIVVVTDFVLFFSVTVADLTLAWRVYVIYSRNVRVLAAVLVIMSGTMVSGIGCLAYDVLIVTHGPDPMYMLQELRYVVGAVTSTVVYNWTVTGLIVARLWWASKRMIENNLFSHYDGVETKPVAQTYQKLIVILVESGAVYSAVWIVWIVAYVKGETWNLGIFVIPIAPRLVALIPTLIVLQRSLGYIQTSELPIAPISHVEFAVITTRPSSPTLIASVSNFKDDSRVGTIHGDLTWPEDITRFREALLLRPKNDPERPDDLYALAHSLGRRYGEEDDIADLYEAVDLLRQALSLMGFDDQRRLHVQRSLNSVRKQLERALGV